MLVTNYKSLFTAHSLQITKELMVEAGFLINQEFKLESQKLSCLFGQHFVYLFVMSVIKIRKITFYKNYFTDFFVKQKQKVKDKIIWTFRIIETQQQIPSDYFEHITGTDGLYEIRVKQGSDIF